MFFCHYLIIMVYVMHLILKSTFDRSDSFCRMWHTKTNYVCKVMNHSSFANLCMLYVGGGGWSVRIEGLLAPLWPSCIDEKQAGNNTFCAPGQIRELRRWKHLALMKISSQSQLPQSHTSHRHKEELQITLGTNRGIYKKKKRQCFLFHTTAHASYFLKLQKYCTSKSIFQRSMFTHIKFTQRSFSRVFH